MKQLKAFFLSSLLTFSTTSGWAQNVDSVMGSETVDGTFTTPGGLTDAQSKEAQNFVHEGRKEAIYNKACKEAGKACDPSSADGNMLENNIGKLYAVVFGGMSMIGGGGPSVNIDPTKRRGYTPPAPEPAVAGAPATNQNLPGGANARPPREKGTDYCMYGAMVQEVIATAMQGSAQSKASQEAAALNDPQLQALVSLKETHKARKRTATFQGAAFGATAACYAAQKLLNPAIVMDAGYILKMSAAAGISVLYLKKADKHANAMKKIDQVIASLPKAGDCNPWTGTACFCSEPTSQARYPGQYQEVCVLNAGKADGNKANLGCGVMQAGKVTLDEKCTCKASNTCITTSLKFANPSIGLGSNFLNTANDGYALLDGSQFDEGKLRDFANGAAALNSRLKPKGALPDVKLTDEQKKIADSLKDVVPPAVANIAATAPTTPSGADSAFGASSGSGLSALPPTLREQMSDPEISGNYRSRGGATSFGAGDEPAFTMPPLPGQGEAAAQGSEVLTFAEKAVSNADVSNRPDTPIFDIISNRYRASGMRRLSVE